MGSVVVAQFSFREVVNVFGGRFKRTPSNLSLSPIRLHKSAQTSYLSIVNINSRILLY